MLRAQGIHEALMASLTNGVEAALLLTTTGVPISSASINPTYCRSTEHVLMTGVMSNIWRSYAACDLSVDLGGEATSEALEALIFEVGDHKICAVGVGGSAVLCLLAARSVESGMLKLKASSLQAHMDKPLRAVAQLTKPLGPT